jgi:type III pantothenate kinase
MNLLLDLGNTRLKWAWDNGRTLTAQGSLAHGEPGWDAALGQLWSTLPQPLAAWLAAVAAEPLAATVQARIASLWPGTTIHRVHSPAAAGGIRNAYREPARLGVDRFLAMLGARALEAQAVVVAGCGTALAVDLLDDSGLHHGGVIAPSPARMRDTVLATTARVTLRDPAALAALGRSTEDGLESGCWLAAAALVDRVVDDAARTLGAAPRLLLHGGDATQLAMLLRHPARLVPDLVLDGLQRWVQAAARPGVPDA